MADLRKNISKLICGRGLIAPSILSADFSKLKEEVDDVVSGGADWIHVDVMDGHFVPNITIGPLIVKALRPHTTLPLDCHLMVSEPEKWIEPFAKSGADVITIHAEVAKDLRASLEAIRSLGCLSGVSINPATDLAAVEKVIDSVELVLVMSVNPGFGGQSFMPEVLDKVKRLKELQKDHAFLIEIDGGINETTIAESRQAGCNVFVAGSAVFGQKDRGAIIKDLKEASQ